MSRAFTESQKAKIAAHFDSASGEARMSGDEHVGVLDRAAHAVGR
jgi:hypothetical protein